MVSDWSVTRKVCTYHIVASCVAIESQHGLLCLCMVVLASIVDVRLGDKPDHDHQELNGQVNHDCSKMKSWNSQLTPVKMNSVAISGLHFVG